jgi:hypothetical protein
MYITFYPNVLNRPCDFLRLGVEKTSLYAVQGKGKRRPPYFAGVDGRAGDLHAVFDESFDERPADWR